MKDLCVCVCDKVVCDKEERDKFGCERFKLVCVCESLCVINLCVTKRCDKFVCARLCVTKLCVCVKDCVVTKRMRRGGGGGAHGGGGLDTEPETRTPHKCCGE